MESNQTIRELALIKIVTAHQDEALSIVGSWGCRLIALGESGFTVELSAAPDSVSDFLTDLGALGQLTVVRTGAVSI